MNVEGDVVKNKQEDLVIGATFLRGNYYMISKGKYSGPSSAASTHTESALGVPHAGLCSLELAVPLSALSSGCLQESGSLHHMADPHFQKRSLPILLEKQQLGRSKLYE